MTAARRGVTAADVPWFVYGIKRLREETHGCGEWHEPGIVAAVRELVGQNFEIACERAFRHAADPDAKTPGAIRRPFVPPAASEKPPTKRGNPHRDEECRRHPGEWPDNCAGCATDANPVTQEDRPVSDAVRELPLSPNLAAKLAKFQNPTEETP